MRRMSDLYCNISEYHQMLWSDLTKYERRPTTAFPVDNRNIRLRYFPGEMSTAFSLPCPVACLGRVASYSSR